MSKPSDDNDSFLENQSDFWAKYFKVGLPIAGTVMAAFGPTAALLGAIAGPILGEVLASTLPNQRLERVITFVRIIRSKFSDAEIENFLKIPEKISFLEEGLYAAGFTPHQDRLMRISNFIASGISKNDFELDKESHLLNIIKNISDTDFIILNYYKLKDEYNDNNILNYKQKYPDIFPRKSQVGENPKIQYEIKFNLEGRKRYLSSLGLLFVLPTNINRPNPKMVGLNSSEDLRKYELDILRDQLIALQEPRYGISFLGEEALERMTSS
jgi:hypothetical protein